MIPRLSDRELLIAGLETGDSHVSGVCPEGLAGWLAKYTAAVGHVHYLAIVIAYITPQFGTTSHGLLIYYGHFVAHHHRGTKLIITAL